MEVLRQPGFPACWRFRRSSDDGTLGSGQTSKVFAFDLHAPTPPRQASKGSRGARMGRQFSLGFSKRGLAPKL